MVPWFAYSVICMVSGSSALSLIWSPWSASSVVGMVSMVLLVFIWCGLHSSPGLSLAWSLVCQLCCWCNLCGSPVLSLMSLRFSCLHGPCGSPTLLVWSLWFSRSVDVVSGFSCSVGVVFVVLLFCHWRGLCGSSVLLLAWFLVLLCCWCDLWFSCCVVGMVSV